MSDYISRETIKDTMLRYGFKAPDMTVTEFVEDELPATDVEPVRHGKWLEWFPGDCALIMTGEEMLYRCSSCDAKYSDAEGYKYCPNCGAVMEAPNA